MKRLSLLALVCLLLVVIGCGGSDENEPGSLSNNGGIANATEASSLPTRVSATRRPITPTRPAEINGLETIALSELPDEALDTLALIWDDGPFPYRQDGGIFQNRERLLPRKANGYYHEYTVETPGSDDRGARRIITGEEGELYYTDDHYDSFKVIIEHE